MSVPSPNKFLRNLAQLLEGYLMLMHQLRDRTQAHHILKRVDAAVRGVTIFVGVTWPKKAAPVPRTKLTLCQTGDP